MQSVGVPSFDQRQGDYVNAPIESFLHTLVHHRHYPGSFEEARRDIFRIEGF